MLRVAFLSLLCFIAFVVAVDLDSASAQTNSAADHLMRSGVRQLQRAEYRAAEKSFQRALARRIQAGTGDTTIADTSIASTRLHLGVSIISQSNSRVAEAEQHFYHAVTLYKRFVIPTDLGLRTAVYHLARCSQIQKKYEAALPLYQIVLKFQIQVGDTVGEHYQNSLLEASNCLRELKRPLEALPLLRHLWYREKSRNPPFNDWFGYGMSFAAAQLEAGVPEEAEAVYVELLTRLGKEPEKPLSVLHSIVRGHLAHARSLQGKPPTN
jgi:tetratricopeptide (TPR) repeat protein